MPKTRFQRVIYTLITVIITVHLFVYYNLAITMGGMSNQVFILAPKIVLVEFIFALILQLFIAGPMSKKIAFSFINPREEKNYMISLAMVCSTVILMCPMMSFVSTALHKGITIEFLAQWMQNIVINFPFALLSQIFFVQPIVKFIFKNIFRSSLEKKSV